MERLVVIAAIVVLLGSLLLSVFEKCITEVPLHAREP